MEKTGDREALIAAAVAGRPYAEIAALANACLSACGLAGGELRLP